MPAPNPVFDLPVRCIFCQTRIRQVRREILFGFQMLDLFHQNIADESCRHQCEFRATHLAHL